MLLGRLDRLAGDASASAANDGSSAASSRAACEVAGRGLPVAVRGDDRGRARRSAGRASGPRAWSAWIAGSARRARARRARRAALDGFEHAGSVSSALIDLRQDNGADRMEEVGAVGDLLRSGLGAVGRYLSAVCLLAVARLEPGHAATGVEDLLLAGVERVAVRADVGVDVAARRRAAGGERVATGAGDRGHARSRGGCPSSRGSPQFRRRRVVAVLRDGREPEPTGQWCHLTVLQRQSGRWCSRGHPSSSDSDGRRRAGHSSSCPGAVGAVRWTCSRNSMLLVDLAEPVEEQLERLLAVERGQHPTQLPDDPRARPCSAGAVPRVGCWRSRRRRREDPLVGEAGARAAAPCCRCP